MGFNLIFNNTSDRLKSYSISSVYLLLLRDWLKKLSVMRDLIEKSRVMCRWNPPLPPSLLRLLFCKSKEFPYLVMR